MGFWEWIAKKYVGKSTRSNVTTIRQVYTWESSESCITRCKFAVPDDKGNYFCFSKKATLSTNSIPNGCNNYRSKSETVGNIRCPKCGNDLIEQIQDNRFKCIRCGKIFS